MAIFHVAASQVLAGAFETWDRFGKAINRGDKDAALRELTPSAQQKYAPVFDTLLPASGGVAPQK